MLRERTAKDWSAEQHEAAAAALGSLAAAVLRMPGYGLDHLFGSPMTMAADQIARWAAVDAASHAYAAMTERDKQSRFLEASQLVEVCAWCPPEEQATVPPGKVATHGICDKCKARELAALDPIDPRD